VSVTEIVAELPKLSQAERRAISRRLLELATQDEDVKLADDLLIAACQELDRREAEDAKANPLAR